MSSAVPDWERLGAGRSASLVGLLRQRYEQGSFATTAVELARDASDDGVACSPNEAAALLDQCEPWLSRLEETVEGPEDPNTGVPSITTTVRYEYRGGIVRQVPWMMFIHGMGTTGEWQQHLSFDLATWQGTAPPAFILKYGTVVVGTFIGVRRRMLLKKLSNELGTVAKRADRHNAGAVPDVVAHSLGTWLIGHLLLAQLRRPEHERLRIGRLIVTGSILRPDFPWGKLQRAGLVDDVLNHYGTDDWVVPMAHWSVRDSGPSGQRGFDLAAADPASNRFVLNVAAPGHGHSDVLDETNDAYERYLSVWKPFLTNPVGHAGRGIDVTDPAEAWKPYPWPARRGWRAHR